MAGITELILSLNKIIFFFVCSFKICLLSKERQLTLRPIDSKKGLIELGLFSPEKGKFRGISSIILSMSMNR